MKSEQDRALRAQCFGMSDPELMKAALFIKASPVFAELRMTEWARALVNDSAEVFRKYGGYTWKQRQALRNIMIKVTAQLVDRKEVGDAVEEVKRWAAGEPPPSTENVAYRTKQVLIKRLLKQNLNECTIEQLESAWCILNGHHAPVFTLAPDGVPCEVCVVCGTLVIPREQPRCEGCPDPEDVDEDFELHIDFHPVKGPVQAKETADG